MWVWSIFGSLGLVFRYWVTNFKIKDLLEHRSWHLSRLLSYFFFLAMITGFARNIFTLIVVGAYPTMIVAFLSFDISFYKSIFRKDWIDRLVEAETGKFTEEFRSNKMRIWIFLERITIHIPLIITGTYFYAVIGVRDFFMPDLQFVTIVIAFLFIMIAYLTVDPRWVKIEEDGHKNEWPAGLYILIGALAEALFLVLYLYIDFEEIFSLN